MTTRRINGDWKVGDTITWRPSRAYHCTASKPYRRKDGKMSGILTWQGKCRACGETYMFTQGRFSFYPVANCERCRATYTPTELARRGKREISHT